MRCFPKNDNLMIPAYNNLQRVFFVAPRYGPSPRFQSLHSEQRWASEKTCPNLLLPLEWSQAEKKTELVTAHIGKTKMQPKMKGKTNLCAKGRISKKFTSDVRPCFFAHFLGEDAFYSVREPVEVMGNGAIFFIVCFGGLISISNFELAAWRWWWRRRRRRHWCKVLVASNFHNSANIWSMGVNFGLWWL